MEQLYKHAYQTFIDGIISGEPIAANVAYILTTAADYGKDVAGNNEHFHASVDYETFDELKRDCVGIVVESLFGKDGIKRAVDTVVLMAAAFGFKHERERNSADFIPENIKSIMDEAVAESGGAADRYISDTISAKLLSALREFQMEEQVVILRRIKNKYNFELPSHLSLLARKWMMS